MLILSMETQHMEMAHREIQKERTKEAMEEITEEGFLKNLYLYMKKRDTPIERIPNLGFKQIDLFLMFKIVREMGGYHQVTAQQLWRQVYNALGGNPRSTSAATCTRRHYEKLLLPYECHVTGVLVNVVPRNQPKHFHYDTVSKEHDDGQRAAKRKLPSIPLLQNPHNFQSEPHHSVIPLSQHYPPYYHQSHAVLPPYVPIPSSVLTPHSPPVPKPWFPFPTSPLIPTEREKEPLEQLRSLADKYKTTSRLTEPLDLRVKEPRRETYSSPASSFSPPSTSNLKFLNKPSPLYTPHRLQVVRNDGCETQSGEAGLGDTPYSYPVKAREAYVVDHEAITASGSPTALTLRTDECATTMAQKPSSPKTEATIRPKEEREGSPEVRELDLSEILPGLPREKEGKMEIEVPLSVFHSWLKLCGSSVRLNGAKQTIPPQEEYPGQRNCSDTDVFPTNLALHMNRQHQSSAGDAEDLRLMQRHFPSSIPTTQSASYHHNTSKHHFTAYKPSPSGGTLQKAASQDIYLFGQQDINKSYSSRPTHCWDAYDKESRAPPIPANTDSSPRTVQQDYSSSISYNEGTVQRGREKTDMGPLAVLMLNSRSPPLLHLTTEEVVKLKKIISSSS